MVTSKRDFAKLFLERLAPCFRPPTDDVNNGAALANVYFDQLCQFDAVTLERAAARILRTRKDPFFPTVAECICVCEDVIRINPKHRTEEEIRKVVESTGAVFERGDPDALIG